MGSKRKPGRFDCYAKALPDEPIFALLGRDPDAPGAIETWANLRAARKGSSLREQQKVAEARRCARQMRRWHRRRQEAGRPVAKVRKPARARRARREG